MKMRNTKYTKNTAVQLTTNVQEKEKSGGLCDGLS